jgi:hypothetical protein
MQQTTDALSIYGNFKIKYLTTRQYRIIFMLSAVASMKMACFGAFQRARKYKSQGGQHMNLVNNIICICYSLGVAELYLVSLYQ